MVETVEIKLTLRRRIIEAADTLIREHGIAGATTREIARAAGCAEGSIYVHFEDKIDPSHRRHRRARAVLRRPARAALEGRRGDGRGQPRSLGRGAAQAPARQPADLLRAHGRPGVFGASRSACATRTGPVAIFRTASSYIGAEQELGRIDERAHPDVVASILIGACRDQVLTHALAGKEPADPRCSRASSSTPSSSASRPRRARGLSTPNVEEGPS